uniref:uncharacterized protein LOC120334759 n=1 Tax=Styela clava TaxID=7725 RepID=UPI00193A40D9|nr:uncharacterized protein LOC120334759 [Styela clava]
MATGGRSDDQHQAMISNAPGSFNEFKTHLDVCRSSSDVSDVSSSASSTFSVRNARVKLELARLNARQEEELSALEDDLRKLRTRHALQAAETESKLCQGEAKNAIDHCSMMEPSRGYREAMRELKNEYGKDHVISRTCLDRLKRGPKLNFDDAKGMQAYARLMRKCGLVLGEISEYDNLNNFDNLLAIVKRLPPESQNAWDFKVATILETEDREASYNDLSKFVTEQANVSRSDFRFARRDRRQSN